MVGQLQFSPREYLHSRWDDEKWRKPLLFSVALHLAILGIALLPSSLFYFSRTTPEIYSVALIDLTEVPPPVVEKQQQEPRKQEPVTPIEPARSLQPVLSTRTIPEAPQEIKLLRPRALKKDVRLPPMDPSMVLAALNRIQQQEQAQASKEEALEAIRQSILTRETAAQAGAADQTNGPDTPRSTASPGTTGSPGYGGPPGSGQAANTALKKYKALVAQHIGRFWSLPEGQVWPKDLRATVLVKVRADGVVTATDLEKPSQNGHFDRFVMQTIEQASPLPPFPEEIPKLPLRLNFYPEGMM